MTTSTDETTPGTFGCTPADVLRLLPHVQIGAPLAEGETSTNQFYNSPQVRRLTEADVQAFIEAAGSRVLARIYRYEEVPDRVQEHIRTMARDLVATGAAWFVQAALHPASSGPNNGSAYANDLRSRFETDLDKVESKVEHEIENPSVVVGTGGVSGSFPAPFFSDEMRF